ncbi:MAG: DUF6502 family protein [Rhodoferax sp.]|uniref:DUF6502 family protein n=1 Tax=Rhodoferax sp. TaxID=50421 RepID=UPI0026058E59|nr:DUF6502 family protein [Rhodoferax sp.]MDD5332692.1 DUF6502 family protein [Rhodoferax sp.]
MTTPIPATDPAPALDAGLPEPALAAQAIALVLQPLARLMIDHGLQLPSLVELLKKALVQEAMTAYGLADKGSSDTRIALLTGVHRKDVRRLREAPVSADPASPMVPVAAMVVARWISEPRYLNADQTARALARTPGRGSAGEPDFTTLVAEVSRDVGARAVFDELARLGVVELQADGYVALKSSAFVPHEGLRESFHFLAANVSDHLATAVHNLAPQRRSPLMLDQSAFSQNLSAEQAQQLQQQARRLWATVLQHFLRTATVAEQRSETAAGPKHRVCFGVYFHDAVQAEAPLAAPAGPKARKSKRKKVL